jgi:dTDP-4-amino-4,6-dideoxygalactose transaminase
MLICPNEDEYKKAKLLRWFGIDREKKIKNNWQAYTQRQMTFDIEMVGYKRQMTDIAASMGLGGLKVYDKIIEHRRNLFSIYKDNLKDLDGIKFVDGKNNTCWLCTVLVERRDDFAKMMFESNIDTNLVQIRNDVFKIFGGERADLPVMNYVEGKYISLPIGMHITETDVNYICSVIKAGW